ncbi:unnamed protein product [Ixodes persulcatus]
MAMIRGGSLHCGRKLCLFLENVYSEMSAGPSVKVLASVENTTGCKNKNKCTFKDVPHFHWFQYKQSLYKDRHYCDLYWVSSHYCTGQVDFDRGDRSCHNLETEQLAIRDFHTVSISLYILALSQERCGQVKAL